MQRDALDLRQKYELCHDDLQTAQKQVQHTQNDLDKARIQTATLTRERDNARSQCKILAEDLSQSQIQLLGFQSKQRKEGSLDPKSKDKIAKLEERLDRL